MQIQIQKFLLMLLLIVAATFVGCESTETQNSSVDSTVSADQPVDDPTVEKKPDSNPKPKPSPTVSPTPTPSPSPTATPTPSPTVAQCQLGHNADLGGRRPFPSDNPWNQDISAEPVDPNSANYIASMGLDTTLHPDFGSGTYNGGPIGIPYVVVPGNQPLVPIWFQYSGESDPGPYPIPPNPPIEGGPNATGDRHILVVDCDNWKLWETFSTYPDGSGWRAGSGAVFNLNTNDLRPAGWTSADAAGLPIFPGLVRYDEVARGEIRHALRFTAARTQRAYVYPARHWASSSTDPNLPPMGMRVRLKANFDISGFPARVQVILRAMKKYGMFLADNGTSWHVQGSPHASWNNDELRALKSVRGRDFEVVRMGTVVR